MGWMKMEKKKKTKICEEKTFGHDDDDDIV